jgi:uncharacterized protein
MNREESIATLKENEAASRSRGVSHVALFSSRARGDNRPDSDIDIMIEIDPEAHVGVWGYVRLKEYIAALFDGPVDVVDREAPQILRGSRSLSTRSGCHRLTRRDWRR